MSKFCIKCGAKNKDDAIFCFDCGYNFSNNSINDFQNNKTKNIKINNSKSNFKENKKILLVLTCIGLLFIGGIVFAQHSNVVVGDSMEPAIHDGDIVLCEKINFFGIKEFNPNELVVGDIITYSSTSFQNYVIGRITKVNNENGVKSYIVKGDKYEGGESVYPYQIISKAMKNGDNPIVIPDLGSFFVA